MRDRTALAGSAPTTQGKPSAEYVQVRQLTV